MAIDTALNRTYRQELESMAQTQGNLTTRNVEQSAKLMDAAGATSAMLTTVIGNLQKAAESIARPPPPPVDYSETILKGLGMAGALALQIVSSVRGAPLPPPPHTDSKDDSVEAGFADKVASEKPPREPSRGKASDESQRRQSQSHADAKERPTKDGTSTRPQATAQTIVSASAETPRPTAETQRLSGETHNPSPEEQNILIQTVADPNGGDGGLDYYLDPKNQHALDDLLTSLDRFKTSKDLDQLIALRMPHLLRRNR